VAFSEGGGRDKWRSGGFSERGIVRCRKALPDSRLAALIADLVRARQTRLVEGRRFSRDCSKSLTTSLIDLACALTRFSLRTLPVR
jgi:hypothetical protein